MELNIDRGLKSYDVKDADGTLIGTIRFNPSDIGLAGRMEEARAKIAEITAAPVTGPEDLVEWDRQVRHWFDYIFGTPVSDVFFAGVSSLAFCEDGSLVAEAVLDAVTPMLTQAVEAAAKASAARIARHADAYQGSTAGLPLSSSERLEVAHQRDGMRAGVCHPQRLPRRAGCHLRPA